MTATVKRLPDDWEKRRTHDIHLTAIEIAEIRRGFGAGEKPRDIARRLGCATRTVSKYFSLFNGRLDGDIYRKPAAAIRGPHTLPDRFYHSNFEPS